MSELTLGEVRDDLAARGFVVSYASVWRTVRRLGLRHKKRTIFAAEQDRLDVAIARDIWRAAQAGLRAVVIEADPKSQVAFKFAVRDLCRVVAQPGL